MSNLTWETKSPLEPNTPPKPTTELIISTIPVLLQAHPALFISYTTEVQPGQTKFKAKGIKASIFLEKKKHNRAPSWDWSSTVAGTGITRAFAFPITEEHKAGSRNTTY